MLPEFIILEPGECDKMIVHSNMPYMGNFGGIKHWQFTNLNQLEDIILVNELCVLVQLIIV